MARNYKRLGGIINASAGPAKARAVFAESFGILRKNVVNLRENPVSSPSSRRMRPVPIGSENLVLRDEVWPLVLKSLDSSCSGLGLAVTGDADGQYPFWPGNR